MCLLTLKLLGCTCIAVSTVTVLLVKRIQPIRHVTFKDEVEEAPTEGGRVLADNTAGGVLRDNTAPLEMENVEITENEVVMPKGKLQLESKL